MRLYKPMLQLQNSHTNTMGANKKEIRCVPIRCRPNRSTNMQHDTSTATSAPKAPPHSLKQSFTHYRRQTWYPPPQENHGVCYRLFWRQSIIVNNHKHIHFGFCGSASKPGSEYCEIPFRGRLLKPGEQVQNTYSGAIEVPQPRSHLWPTKLQHRSNNLFRPTLGLHAGYTSRTESPLR